MCGKVKGFIESFGLNMVFSIDRRDIEISRDLKKTVILRKVRKEMVKMDVRKIKGYYFIACLHNYLSPFVKNKRMLYIFDLYL